MVHCTSFPQCGQVPVAQLDKASDYESEDWGFKSLQGLTSFCMYIFLSARPPLTNPLATLTIANANLHFNLCKVSLACCLDAREV